MRYGAQLVLSDSLARLSPLSLISRLINEEQASTRHPSEKDLQRPPPLERVACRKLAYPTLQELTGCIERGYHRSGKGEPTPSYFQLSGIGANIDLEIAKHLPIVVITWQTLNIVHDISEFPHPPGNLNKVNTESTAMCLRFVYQDIFFDS